jgi:hypothetical protein
VSGCANPCGGEGRVGNRPLGGRGAGTGPGGLWRLGQPLWVGSWYGRSWGSSRSASGVGALKSERTSSRGPGTAFAEGPAQRETAKAEVHGGAAVPRARRGAKPCPTPTQAERPQRLSGQLRSQNGSTCLGPSGIWAEPLLPVAGFRGGLSGLGRIQEALPDDSLWPSNSAACPIIRDAA